MKPSSGRDANAAFATVGNIHMFVARQLSWILGMAALMAWPGSRAARAAEDQVLATIAGVAIRQSDFNRYIQSGPESTVVFQTNTPARQDALNAYLDLQVLCAKALKEGIDASTNFQKASELMEMKLLVTALSERDREVVRANRQSYMDGIRAEVGLKATAFATNDGPIVLGQPGTNALLATIGSLSIYESDFEWFLKDAFRAEQRRYVFNKTGARKSLTSSFLNMKALEAKARKDRLDQTAAFESNRAAMKARLLAEFLQERDRMMPWQLNGSEAEREQKLRDYLRVLRVEMNFTNLVRN